MQGLLHVCPWITRNVINNEYCRQAKKCIFYIEPDTTSLTTTSVGGATPANNIVTTFNIEQKEGGMLLGSNNSKMKNCESEIIVSKYKIAQINHIERDNSG